MNNKVPSLGDSIAETMLSKPVKSIAAEYAEVGLDAVLSNEVLKEIPFVNTLVAVTKVGLTLSDRLLVNKLLKFLGALQGVSPDVHREMVARLESDPVFGRKVGVHVLELLSRIEGGRKPEMLAKVFAAYANGDIDATTLLRLNFAIERLPMSELAKLRPFYFPSDGSPLLFGDDYAGQAFLFSGLAKMSPRMGGSMAFETTHLGDTFLALKLDEVGA